MPFHIYTYENPEVINSNIVLKHILKKKYEWVIDVNLVFVTVRESKNSRDFNEVVLDGVIKVDEDWYEKNWPEYKKYGPVPKPNDSYVVLGELLMGKSAIEFNSECRKALTLSLKKQIDGVIWSDLVVKTEEIKKEDITESIRRILREEVKSKKSKKVVCSECGWSWKLSEGGHDPYTCHKCGNVNSKSELTEKCWAGYTQKGMKTMFGKRYPNCVKKTKK
jgi:hypothetical protein